MRKKKKSKTARPWRIREYAPPERRMRVVQEALDGTSPTLISKVFGVSVSAISKWAGRPNGFHSTPPV